VHVPLGDALPSVAEQAADGKLREVEVPCHAGKRVAERMRGDVLQPRPRTDPLEHPDHPDEVARHCRPGTNSRCRKASPAARMRKEVRQISSDFSVLKNVSTMALSKQLPLPDIEMMTPAAGSSA